MTPLTLEAIDQALRACVDSAEFTPNLIVIPRRTFHRLARAGMTKRRYRRWRGRQRAAWREAQP